MSANLVNVPLEKFTKVPLCEAYRDDPRGGNLLLYSKYEANAKDFINRLKGVFSFVYYYLPKRNNKTAIPADFLQTQWYKGLQVYLDFVHDPAGVCQRGEGEKLKLFDEIQQKYDTFGPDVKKAADAAIKTPPLDLDYAKRFETWGVVIYTDIKTLPLLRGIFPFETYPKLIIAVVDWPYYSIEGGVCEPSILRCLRFQATELFQGKTIFIRDADTIFVKGLQLYTSREDYITYLILWWEADFLKQLSSEYNNLYRSSIHQKLQREGIHLISKDIIIGTMEGYTSSWHKNLPGPFPLSPYVNQYRFRHELGPRHLATHAAYNGVFAGFVNVSKHVTQPLWKNSIDYLTQRYFIAIDRGARVISDRYCTASTGGSFIGKDERILLFVYPMTIPIYNIEYYFIEYSSIVSNHPAVIKSEWWPIAFQTIYGASKSLFVDHLLSPHYNKGVHQTLVKTINQSLRDEMEKDFERYKEYLGVMDFTKEVAPMASKLEECNLHLTREDMFLKEAGILSPDELVSQLDAPVPSLASLRKTAKNKNNAIRAQWRLPPSVAVNTVKPSMIMGGSRRRRRTRKN